MAENSKIEWRHIPGFEGQYDVSNTGLVRRLAHSIVRGDGVKQTYKAKTMALSGNRYKFLRLRLKKYYVHRLVMLAFVGECPSGHEVNHKDCDKSNNHFSNLEYVTRSENNQHAIDNLGCRRGERQWNSVLTRQQVVEIKQMLYRGMKQQEIAKVFGTTQTNISAIKNNRSWTHVEVDYG